MKNYWYRQKDQRGSNASPRILAYAFSDNQETDKATALSRVNQEAEIKWTAEELNNIKTLYGTIENQFLYGKKSTKTDFIQRAGSDNDIIHLALHAESDNTDRYNNRIFFRSENSLDSNNALYGYEIERLDITAALVVLSACQTGTGEVLKAEGTFNLARSFMIAGVAEVVSSLWSIDDFATQELMHHFYRHLHNNETVARSLQLAQLDYLSNTDAYKAYPGYWAAFILLK